MLTITVPESAGGSRLDVFIAGELDGLSRARARALVADGKVRINGHIARKGSRLRSGDRVQVSVNEPDELKTSARFDPEPDGGLDLQIVYQDRFLVVVDKPAGVPCHPLRPGEHRTVASALLARFPEMAGISTDRREAGLVHRLDTETSGLLMAARDPDTLVRLRAALKSGGVEKRYRALCAGRIDAPQRITNWLRSDRADRRRVKVVLRAGKRTRPASTQILKSEPAGELSLVRIGLYAARRHQIRAHLAWLGHPLAGDRLYGGPDLPGLDRHFLHASEIRLAHPRYSAPLRLISELPADLRGVLAGLG